MCLGEEVGGMRGTWLADCHCAEDDGELGF